MTDSIKNLIYLFVDIFVYMVFMGIIFMFLKTYNMQNDFVTESMSTKNTIFSSQDPGIINYTVTEDKETDGILSGINIFNEILECDENVQIYIDVNNLNSMRVGNINFLYYVKNIDASPLLSLLSLTDSNEITYYREYELDAGGTIVKIKYRKI